MSGEDRRTEVARIRGRARALQSEIARVKGETRFFLRMGFGRDIKDIQLHALEEEFQQCLTQITTLAPGARVGSPKKTSTASWLLVPLAFFALALEMMQGKRRVARVRSDSERPMPDRVSPIVVGELGELAG